MQNLLIRNIEIQDLAEIFFLGEKLFTYKNTPNLYRTWDDYAVVEFFLTDKESCFSAIYDDKLVGFLLSTIIDKNNSSKKYGYLVWLGVSPIFCGKGIASKLFDKYKNYMAKEGVKTCLIDTQADNKSAISFFKSKGFTSPEDHIYLTLKL